MWKRLFNTPYLNSIRPKYGTPISHTPCFRGVLSKVYVRDSACGVLQSFSTTSQRGFHSTRFLKGGDIAANDIKNFETSPASVDVSLKVKRKKLKGKRAVVMWLKRFRYLKKKQLQRMTPEERLLFRLNKARNKEARLLEALKKLEPKEYTEVTHDPEVLTPEEHFYFLKMALKLKNYVPVGRRGIYQGVILNMHLHWKKHQTVQVIVKTFTPVEVNEIAVELARLTGGIVLDIQNGDTIIMYRGKNYAQPPTEIMSPRVTLPRKKALDKSKYRDALRAMRRYIPRLEQELESVRAQLQNKDGLPTKQVENTDAVSNKDVYPVAIPNSLIAPTGKIKARLDRYNQSWDEHDSQSSASMGSESEDLSDMFETDSDQGITERPLYLDQFDKFPARNINKEVSLSSMSAELTDFDEVDQIFLRAAKVLKQQR